MPDLTRIREQIAGLRCPYDPSDSDDIEAIEHAEAFDSGWNRHRQLALAIIDAAIEGEPEPKEERRVHCPQCYDATTYRKMEGTVDWWECTDCGHQTEF
jgi:hypothetical protein